MKNLGLLFLLGLLIGCQSTATTTTISGVIKNQSAPLLMFQRGDFSQEVKLAEDGCFSTVIKDFAVGSFTFKHGRKSGNLFIMPGQDFSFELDANEFDQSLTFAGAGAAANNYLVQKKMRALANPIDYRAFFSVDEQAFLNQLDSIEKAKWAIVSKTTALPESFKALEKKALYFEKMSDIGNYQSAHQHFTNNKSFRVSKDFLKMLNNVSLDNQEDYENFAGYRSLVAGHYIEMEAKDMMKAVPAITSPLIKKEVLNFLEHRLIPGSDDLEDVYHTLMSNYEEEEIKKKLTEKYEHFLTLTKGNPSPIFNFEDRNGKMVSLEDLKGKNVYIDVWATWCGPCKAEIPSLKALETTYHNKNIEFVSISIDKLKDKEKWLKMIADKDLSGIQVFADNDWNSEFIKNYGISGIPRFILLDDEGKIVSADAPRPSSNDEIKGMINLLNI